jgi:hypothetical protein
MKRDIQLIRLLLLEIEGEDPKPDFSPYTEDQMIYHSALIIDAGLADGAIVKNSEGYPAATSIIRLTWAGHDFLDASRDSKIWKAAMQHIIKPGVSWTFQVLMEWLKREAQQRFLGVQTSSCNSISPHVV